MYIIFMYYYYYTITINASKSKVISMLLFKLFTFYVLF